MVTSSSYLIWCWIIHDWNKICFYFSQKTKGATSLNENVISALVSWETCWNCYYSYVLISTYCWEITENPSWGWDFYPRETRIDFPFLKTGNQVLCYRYSSLTFWIEICTKALHCELPEDGCTHMLNNQFFMWTIW